jgi:cell division transport system ATP-binding protein
MITATNLTKQFGDGSYGVLDINLTIEKGEFVFLMGSSGAGKTTLLNLLIGKYKPTQGELNVADVPLHKTKSKNLFKLRRKIGVVFQDFKLLEDRTIYENIALSYDVQGIPQKQYKSTITELLSKVGLPGKEKYFPIQLSGGELQRVAIARAMAAEPELILADEPTGDLDLDTSWEILELFQELNANGVTILMATHNHIIVEKLNKRVLLLEDGRLENDTHANSITQHNSEIASVDVETEIDTDSEES